MITNNDSCPKRFLIVKTSSLGDIIHAFSALSYLKQKFPTALIDWVVEKQFAELVQAHPLVNRTLCVETRKWRKGWLKKESLGEMKAFRNQLRETPYNAVFDLQGNIKSGLITLQAKSANKVGFAIKTVPEWPNCLFTTVRFNPPAGQNIRQDYLTLLQNYFNDLTTWDWNANAEVAMKVAPEMADKLTAILVQPELQNRKKVMVCPGSAWRNKQMNTEALCVLLNNFQQELNSSFIFVWGTNDEKELAKQLHNQFIEHSVILDRLPLPALQNLMNQVDLVITMDSLPLHLAGTTRTPSYSVFGASSAAKYKPIGNKHLAFQGSCPYGRTFEKRCPILRTCFTGACIQNRTGNELFENYVKQILAASNANQR